MSDKPSLYVVEKKEVIILVVLFVLVTVLSFTLGVRYGESVGRKQAHEQQTAAQDHEGAGEGSGTLGKAGSHADEPKHEEKSADAHGEKAAEEGHDAAKEAKAEHKEEHKDEHGDAAKGHDEPAATASEHDSHSPEAAAKGASRTAIAPTPEVVDKNSDEYLLNALKSAGVEPPGGRAPKESKLPDQVKENKSRGSLPPKLHSGAYVIQVGSHPTRGEAESQVRQLKSRKVEAEILPAFKDKQGEWHRVVIASFKNKREAEREAGGLKNKGAIVSYFVWRLP